MSTLIEQHLNMSNGSLIAQGKVAEIAESFARIRPKKRKADQLIESLKKCAENSAGLDDLVLEKQDSDSELAIASSHEPKKFQVTCDNIVSNDTKCNSSSRRKNSEAINYSNYIAIDCEMVSSLKNPNALARCTIVDFDGKVVYDKYVKPYSKILDYRTQYSGILPHHMTNATPFSVAQRQIRGIISGKNVVGHTLSSDFKAIGFDHPADKTVDISRLKSLRNLLGLKGDLVLSLKRMTKALLMRDIQTGPHCSHEDAWATMELFKLSLDPSQVTHQVVIPPKEPKDRQNSVIRGRIFSKKNRSKSAGGLLRNDSSLKSTSRKSEEVSAEHRSLVDVFRNSLSSGTSARNGARRNWSMGGKSVGAAHRNPLRSPRDVDSALKRPKTQVTKIEPVVKKIDKKLQKYYSQFLADEYWL